MINTFQARRPCQIGDGWRDIGEPCPEAHLWRLSQGLITGGVLVEIEMAESDFVDAVERYAPGEAEQIYAAVGVNPVGNSNTKSKPKKTLTRAPELLVK